MREPSGRRVYPELRALVAEATRSLAQLDAKRLEELALCCEALNRDWHRELETGVNKRIGEMARQARDAQADMAVFGRVLEATQGNVAVMNRIRALRRDAIADYSAPAPRSGGAHGND